MFFHIGEASINYPMQQDVVCLIGTDASALEIGWDLALNPLLLIASSFLYVASILHFTNEH